MNHLKVSSIYELVCGAGLVELGCWHEASSEFIFFSRKVRMMAAKLPLSEPSSVLCQYRFGSLHI